MECQWNPPASSRRHSEGVNPANVGSMDPPDAAQILRNHYGTKIQNFKVLYRSIFDDKQYRGGVHGRSLEPSSMSVKGVDIKHNAQCDATGGCHIWSTHE